MSESAGSTEEGKPYQMKFPDAFGNVHVRSVPRPEVISDFFDDSNCVDIHNQLRQFAIKLEKKWITSDAYFVFIRHIAVLTQLIASNCLISMV